MAKPRGRKLLKKQQKNKFDPESSKEVSKTHHTHEDDYNYNNDYDNEYQDEEYNGDTQGTAPQENSMFYGILDKPELEYFKTAESTLSLDTFESPEEKAQFVQSVIEEARGKELKLVTSQICSKLMERLIEECDDDQLKKLFQAFSGNFYGMACHKYASHVLESLLYRSASAVERELLTPHFDGEIGDSGEDGQQYVTMENLFLYMLNELKPQIREMVSHKYASHALRLIILILASKPLDSPDENNSALRSKRSKIARKMVNLKGSEISEKGYQTPNSFKQELKEMLKALYADFTNNAPSRTDISTSTVIKFRELCVDKIASPVIQLIFQVEGIFDRDRSFWRLAFGTGDEKDPREESFLEYLLSDSVGSHFLEAVISSGRSKYVERLYELYMKDRIVKLAKRDTTGAFVVQALLTHLNSKEVREILDALVPELSVISNSNVDFGTAIIAASQKEGNYLRSEIIDQLLKRYYPEDSENKNILESCLLLSSSTLGNTKDDWPTADERRRSLLLEELIDYDEKFLDVTIDSMLNLPKERLLQMCYHGVFSHVVEKVLDPRRVDTIKRKYLLNVLCPDAVNLSCNAYGSHIMDRLWDFTAKLMLYKERIANALVGESAKVKNSMYGRQVWRNWKLDLFMRKKYDWSKLVKEHDQEIFPNSKPLQPSVGSSGGKQSQGNKRSMSEGSGRQQKKFKRSQR